MTDPNADPAAETARRVGRLLVLAVQIAELAIQLAEIRAATRAQRDTDAAAVARARLHTVYAEARTRWGPARDSRWLARAGTLDVAAVWGAAAPWAARGDPDAAGAMRTAEGRLRELHPEAMGHYDRCRAAGLGPREAMSRAVSRMGPRPRGGEEHDWRPGARRPYPGPPGPRRPAIGPGLRPGRGDAVSFPSGLPPTLPPPPAPTRSAPRPTGRPVPGRRPGRHR